MGEKNRRGESGALPPRCDRFFRLANEWYFRTRENHIHGPFASKDEAEKALVNFLSTVLRSVQ